MFIKAVLIIIMTDLDNFFFELIRVDIGNQMCLSHTPSAAEWGEL